MTTLKETITRRKAIDIIHNNDYSILNELCKQSYDFNRPFAEWKELKIGKTWLSLAAYTGNFPMVDYLLNKAHVLPYLQHNQDALVDAIVRNYPPIVMKLIQHGADPLFVDSGKMTPLMYACIHSEKTAFLLLPHTNKEHINHHDKRKITALHCACMYGSEKLIEELV